MDRVTGLAYLVGSIVLLVIFIAILFFTVKHAIIAAHKEIKKPD